MDSVNTPARRNEAAQGQDFATIATAAARLVDDMLAYDTDTSRETARMFEALAAKMAEFAFDNAAWPKEADAPACAVAADAAAEASEAAREALHANAEARAMKALNEIKNPIRGFEAREMFERVEGHDFEAIESAVKYIEELAAIDKADRA